MFRVRRFSGFSDLPPAHLAVVDEARRGDFFTDPAWFKHLMSHFYPGAQEIGIYALERLDTGEPLLLMPLRLCNIDYAAFGARSLGAISHPENYSPVALLFSHGIPDQEGVLTDLLRCLRSGGGADGSPIDMLRLWPVDTASDTGKMLRRALRRAGFWMQTYANSYNRYEDTEGLSYEQYFANRSANLRYSVRRRQRALEKSGILELALYRDPDGLDEAIEDYMSVSLGSWKDPESMVSGDVLALIRLTAMHGCLRLGILRFDGIPAAAQFWIISGGVAHCARLAYHEDFKQKAVGVVLTNFMIAHVLDHDHVARIDFGYGEEDYKGGWMQDARDYHGFLAFNPSTRLGIFHGLKNILGRPAKRGIKAILNALHLRTPNPDEGMLSAPRGRNASRAGTVDR